MVHVALGAMLSRCGVCCNNLLGRLLLLLPHLRQRRLLLLLWRLHCIPCCRHASSSSRDVPGCCHTRTWWRTHTWHGHLLLLEQCARTSHGTATRPQVGARWGWCWPHNRAPVLHWGAAAPAAAATTATTACHAAVGPRATTRSSNCCCDTVRTHHCCHPSRRLWPLLLLLQGGRQLCCCAAGADRRVHDRGAVEAASWGLMSTSAAAADTLCPASLLTDARCCCYCCCRCSVTCLLLPGLASLTN